MLPRLSSYSLFILLATAFLVRLFACAVLVGLGSTPDSGYQEYHIAATRLLQHGTMVSPLLADDAPPVPSAILSPGYVGLLAGVYWLLGAQSFAAGLCIQLINCAAGALAVWLAFKLALRLSGLKAAWLAATLVCFNPMLLRFTTFVWDTSIFTAGITLAVLLAVRLGETPRRWHKWLGFGVFLGILALLNPALTIAYPILVLMPAMQSYPKQPRRISYCVALTLAGWALSIAPWTARNTHHFGKLIYVRSGFMNELWLGVCPEAETDGSLIFKRWYALDNDEVRQELTTLGEQEFLAATRRKALDAIRNNPARYARLVAARATDYWTGTVFSHVAKGASGWPGGTGRRIVSVLVMLEGLALLVGYVWFGRSGRAMATWLLLVCGLFSVVYCLTHVELRYRAPTDPLFAVAVAVLFARGKSASERIRGDTNTTGAPPNEPS